MIAPAQQGRHAEMRTIGRTIVANHCITQHGCIRGEGRCTRFQHYRYRGATTVPTEQSYRGERTRRTSSVEDEGRTACSPPPCLTHGFHCIVYPTRAFVRSPSKRSLLLGEERYWHDPGIRCSWLRSSICCVYPEAASEQPYLSMRSWH